MKDTKRIGRAVDNDIVLEDSQASRYHAVIIQGVASQRLHDLNSSNGTFLNERRLAEPRVLQDRDLIRVGKTLLLVRRRPASKEALPPPQYGTSATMVGPAPSAPVEGQAWPSKLKAPRIGTSESRLQPEGAHPKAPFRLYSLGITPKAATSV